MMEEVAVRQCIAADAAALIATEPPGSGIAGNLLHHQAAGSITYGAAWHNGIPVGTVVMDLTSDHTPELKHLFVQETARGSGVGSALCAWVEDQALRAGFEKLYLGVGLENQGARRLYGIRGFLPVGQTTTTTYQYVDENGQKQWATETDEILAKPLA